VGFHRALLQKCRAVSNAVGSCISGGCFTITHPSSSLVSVCVILGSSM